MTIPLDAGLPLRLKLPTRMPGVEARPRGCPRDIPIRHCSRWGLPCRSCCQSRGGLLPHRFTLTVPRGAQRFHFCGAFRRIAPPGRYPAPWLQGVRTFLERLPARGHPALRALVSYARGGPGSSPETRRHFGHDRAIAPIQGTGRIWPEPQAGGAKQIVVGQIGKPIGQRIGPKPL